MSYTFANPFCKSLFIVIIFIIKSTSKGIGFTANQKYAYVGRRVINIPTLIQQKSYNLNWEVTPAVITIVYQRAASTSNVNVLATMGDVELKNINRNIYLIIDEYNITSTQMLVSIYTGNASNIVKLTINYAYFQKDYQYTNNILLYQIEYYFNNGYGRYFSSNNSTKFTLYEIIGQQMNLTGGAKVIPIIDGMIMSSTDSSLTLNIHVEASIFNSTSIAIVFSSTSTIPTLVYEMYILTCIYNPQFVNSASSKLYNLYSGYVTSPFTSSGNIQMTSFNTIIGLSSFSISTNTIFNFYTSVNTSGITIGYDYPFNSFIFVYLTIYSYYCDYTTPYYDRQAEQCWPTCRGTSVSDRQLLECLCYINNSRVNTSNCNPLVSSLISQSTSPSSSSINLIIGIVAGVVGCIIATVAVFLIARKCKQANTTTSITGNITKQVIFSTDINKEIFKNNKINQNSIQEIQPEFAFKRQADDSITPEQIKVSIDQPNFYPSKNLEKEMQNQ